MLAGVLAGRAVARSERAWLPAAADGVVVGALCGLLWLLAAALSAGSVGGQRLAEVGPYALAVGLAVTALVGLPAALTAAGLRYRAGRLS